MKKILNFISNYFPGIIFLILISIGIFYIARSCKKTDIKTEEEHQSKKESELKQYFEQKKDSLIKLNIYKRIKLNYGNIKYLDSIHYKRTYQFQELIKDSNIFIIRNYKNNDIIKKDSNYFIRISSYLWDEDMNIEFYCPRNKLNYFQKNNLESDYDENTYLILKITSIEKKSGDDFSCKGELLNIY